MSVTGFDFELVCEVFRRSDELAMNIKSLVDARSICNNRGNPSKTTRHAVGALHRLLGLTGNKEGDPVGVLCSKFKLVSVDNTAGLNKNKGIRWYIPDLVILFRTDVDTYDLTGEIMEMSLEKLDALSSRVRDNKSSVDEMCYDMCVRSKWKEYTSIHGLILELFTYKLAHGLVRPDADQFRGRMRQLMNRDITNELLITGKIKYNDDAYTPFSRHKGRHWHIPNTVYT